MTESSEPSANATEIVRQRKPTRWRRIVAMVICAIALFWYASALYQRLAWPWHWAHNIQGFVAYGAHEDKFSPDGSQIAVAFRDQCKVLDLASGKEISRLERYTGRGLSDFSSDGKIVSWFPDGAHKAYLWKASDGRILGSVDAPENVSVEKCWPSFSPNGKRIVGACANGLMIWDSSNLKCLGQVKVAWPKDEWLPGLLSWNPTNQELTAVNADGKLLKIDVDQDTAKPLFVKQERAVKSARWSPDGTRIVAIDRDDGSVAVWDAQAGTMVASIPEKDVLYASFSPDSKEVVTGRRRTDVVRTGRWAPPVWDRSTKIWDATSGKLVKDLPTTGIVKFSPDWLFRVETGPEGLRIARADGSESCYFPEWFDGHGSSCVFARDNSYLASVNGSGRVAIWRHHDPTHSWIECLAGYEFWMSILTLIGLAWAMSGFRTNRDSAPT